MHLRYVMDAVSQIRKTLNNEVPLIGFAGSPFTLACYMVEGGSSSDFSLVKTMLYQRPELLHHILDINARAVTSYLNAQIEAGAQAVMIFDSWGGALSHAAYHEFSLPYMEQIVSGLIREHNGATIPNIVFTKGGGLWLESIAAIGCDAVGLDWTIDIGQARRPRRRQGGAARQPRPGRAVQQPRHHPRRSRQSPAQLRQGQRPRVQPGPWHFAVHQPGKCRRHGRGGARTEQAVPRLGASKIRRLA